VAHVGEEEITLARAGDAGRRVLMGCKDLVMSYLGCGSSDFGG